MTNRDPRSAKASGEKPTAGSFQKSKPGGERPSVVTESDELRLQPLEQETGAASPKPLASRPLDTEAAAGVGDFALADLVSEDGSSDNFATDDFGTDLPDFEVPTVAAPIAAARVPENSAASEDPIVAKPVVAVATAIMATEVLDDVTHSTETIDEEEQERILESAERRKFFLTAAPSWLISLLVHVGLILVLAAITLDPVNTVISILQASASESEPALEEFSVEAPALDSADTPQDPLAAQAPAVTAVSLPQLTAPLLPEIDATMESLSMNSLTESIIPSAILDTSALAQMSSALNSRSSASKSEMLERFGGNAASEKAVAMGLKWIAQHQAPDGGWNFMHSPICGNQCKDAGELALARNGATAMAILPFLGAGQTHVEGQYKQTVKRGLAFLINRMQVTPGALPYGSWHEPGGRTYSHGLAAIAVCEAYAMTGDPDLLQPAQLSLNYLVYAQSERDGGWRYEPKQPGDTSVVGWCVMALKSGKMGNLVVPNSTFAGADRFLNYVSSNNGAYYGYDKPTAKVDGRQATIAVGLLCRMYMGWPKEHPGMEEGVKFLSKRGPSLGDLYYSYYATQVLRHHGGAEWEKWNKKMRDELVKSQEQEGHAAGSWYTGKGGHAEKGGRLYATSLATMILEVYYRHMPLYSERSAADDFEI